MKSSLCKKIFFIALPFFFTLFSPSNKKGTTQRFLAVSFVQRKKKFLLSL